MYKITKLDKKDCDEGIMFIIDTSTMKEYYNKEWHEIETLKRDY